MKQYICIYDNHNSIPNLKENRSHIWVDFAGFNDDDDNDDDDNDDDDNDDDDDDDDDEDVYIPSIVMKSTKMIYSLTVKSIQLNLHILTMIGEYTLSTIQVILLACLAV